MFYYSPHCGILTYIYRDGRMLVYLELQCSIGILSSCHASPMKKDVLTIL